MHPKHFISKLDDKQIVAAIREAEKKTSGEIRVYISSKQRQDAMNAATERFAKLGMTKTRERNGVLIYFAPVTRKFAIVGDSGIHQKCGQNFWDKTVGEMMALLKEEKFSEAVVQAVRKTGDLLAKHFPATGGDTNELSDEIIKD